MFIVVPITNNHIIGFARKHFHRNGRNNAISNLETPYTSKKVKAEQQNVANLLSTATEALKEYERKPEPDDLDKFAR